MMDMSLKAQNNSTKFEDFVFLVFQASIFTLSISIVSFYILFFRLILSSLDAHALYLFSLRRSGFPNLRTLLQEFANSPTTFKHPFPFYVISGSTKCLGLL